MGFFTSQSITRLLFAAIGMTAIVVAFLRGNYLLGPRCGLTYAAITLSLLWLLARSQTSQGRVSIVRAGLILALTLPVGYALAFPASINSDVQLFIDDHATDRRVRAELAAVFASDPAYRDLSVSLVHSKIINLTVRGSLDTRADLDRLQARLAVECPTLRECLFYWEISFRSTVL